MLKRVLEPCLLIDRIYSVVTTADCRLQVLWLGDNYLTAIEDISTLTRLRDLNLARNDISVIGDSLVGDEDV